MKENKTDIEDIELFNEKENISDFLEKTRKKFILSVALGILCGSLGGLRFYQKRFYSGTAMLLLSLFSYISTSISQDPIISIISFVISISLFIVVILDLIKLFKENEKVKIDKLNELRSEK